MPVSHKPGEQKYDHTVPLTDEQSALVAANWMLAKWFAKKASRNMVIVDDDAMLSAAQMGLIRAARTYDPTRGKFSNWAHWWMRSTVWMEVLRNNPITPPQVASGDWEGTTEPTKRAVRIARSIRRAPNGVMVDGVVLDSGIHVAASGQPGPVACAVAGEQAEIIGRALSGLTPSREDLVRRCVMTGEISVSEWARQHGVSKQRGDQIKKRVLEILKPILERKGLA